MDGKAFGRFAVVVAGAEGGDVGGLQGRLLGELFLDPADGLFGVLVEPVDEAQGEEFLQRSASRVLRPLPLTALRVSLVIGTLIDNGRRQRTVLERVDRVAGLAEVAVGEGVAVGDQDAVRAEVAATRLIDIRSPNGLRLVSSFLEGFGEFRHVGVQVVGKCFDRDMIHSRTPWLAATLL